MNIRNILKSLRVTALVALGACANVAVMALDLGENFELHGYGDISRELRNVDATGQGRNARESTFENSWVGIWTATDRVKFWVQVAADESSPVHFDGAFLDYQSESGLTYRVGRVRVPFGMHSEKREAQALRPSASLPFLYDVNLNLIDESLEGGMIRRGFAIGGGQAMVEAYAARAVRDESTRVARGLMVGGRLMMETPVEGLTLGVSGYQGELERNDGNPQLSKRSWALSARYQGDRVDLQAEYGRGFIYTRDVSTWYLQAAVPLAEQWKAVTRIEEMVTDLAQSNDDAYREQRVIVGLAYAINHYLGLRLEQQFHRGYASRVVNEALAPGDGRQHWTSTLLSLNYKF